MQSLLQLGRKTNLKAQLEKSGSLAKWKRKKEKGKNGAEGGWRRHIDIEEIIGCDLSKHFANKRGQNDLLCIWGQEERSLLAVGGSPHSVSPEDV